MKRWSKIAAAVMIAIFAVKDLVHDFVSNDTVGYYSAEPHQLLYVAAIAIAVGLAVLGFTRLSPRAQRHVRVIACGSAAGALTVIAGDSAYTVIRLSSLLVQSGSTVRLLLMPLLLVLLMLSGIAAYFWYECFHALKIRDTR
jgi:hypothetical protein